MDSLLSQTTSEVDASFVPKIPGTIKTMGDWATVTVNVTGTLSWLSPAVEDAIEICPLYVPCANPGATLTESVAVVLLPFGATDSQVPPEVVLAEAVKLNTVPVLETERFWGGIGPGAPCWYKNESVPGDTASEELAL